MSDFVSSGWAIYIAAATVLGMVGCIALLVFASRGKVQSGDNTTGHVWDVDLRELNNPLPRWWMWLFVGTVVFSFVYLALYPGLGSYAGTLNWTSRNQLEAEQARARQAMAPVYAKFKTMTPEQLAADPQAMAIGQRLFLNQCAQCHGSDARGSKGFPDLTRPAPARQSWVHCCASSRSCVAAMASRAMSRRCVPITGCGRLGWRITQAISSVTQPTPSSFSNV